jgi:lipid-A-disaccharide synthase
MKYYLIAGEASGDLHGANLMKAILKNDPQARFRFWGGDKMQQVGGTLVKHYRDLAFMGFVEVFMNLRTIQKNFALCRKELLDFAPDVVVLIDYPGFNLRMARFARKKGMKVVFYISPTVWAWKQSRVHKIKKYVNRMMVILPFEKDFYAKFGCDVDFVGHPLLDELAEEKPVPRKVFLEKNNLADRPIVALLPGSREQEIKKILPEMLCVAADFPDYRFVVAGASPDLRQVYEKFHVPVVYGQTHALLRQADAAVVASGTATLETALLDVPQVVVYKMNLLTFILARQFVRLRFVSLVNLILDKEVVKEFLQRDLTRQNLSSELSNLLKNKDYREQMLSEYRLLRKKLGTSGASRRAAEVIAEVLADKQKKPV